MDDIQNWPALRSGPDDLERDRVPSFGDAPSTDLLVHICSAVLDELEAAASGADTAPSHPVHLDGALTYGMARLATRVPRGADDLRRFEALSARSTRFLDHWTSVFLHVMARRHATAMARTAGPLRTTSRAFDQEGCIALEGPITRFARRRRATGQPWRR